MSEWWSNLGALKQIFYFIAVPATAVLIVQSALAIIGLGGSEVDMDMDTSDGIGEPVELEFGDGIDAGDEAFSGDFKFFTVRGLIAFFAVLGWTGAAMSGKAPTFLVVVAAFVAGFLAMSLIGYLFFAMTKLQSSGNIRYANCMGKTGEVYMNIPAESGGKGKVFITVQGRLIEAGAVTKQPEPIKSGETIHVVGVMSDHTLIVEKGDRA